MFTFVGSLIVDLKWKDR